MLGDVKKLYNKFGKFNHVFMPYPAKAKEFLEEAIEIGDTVHYYFFAESWEEGWKEISRHGSFEIIDKRKVLPYSPGKWKWRITFSRTSR